MKILLLLIGMTFSVIGTFILAFPLLKSDKEIVEISATVFDASPNRRKSLIKERIYGRIGVIFTSIDYFIQIFSIIL